MKRVSIFIFVFFIFAGIVFSQEFENFADSTYEVKISMSNVDVSELSGGDSIYIRVKLADITNGDSVLTPGYVFRITYDTNYLSFAGLENINNQVFCCYPPGYFIEVSYDTISVSWFTATYCSVLVNENETFFDFLFVYKGNLPQGQSSPVSWAECMFIDMFYNLYNVFSEDGSIYNGLTGISNIPDKNNNFIISCKNGQVLEIDNKSNSTATFQISDLTGRILKKERIFKGKNRYDLTIERSLYLITVFSADGVFTKKVYLY